MANEDILRAMHALFAALGEPERRPLSEIEVDPDRGVYDGLHPVFDLAETFAPNDPGYTSGAPVRGQHQSVPCYGEDGSILVVETSFHKGEMTVERVEYRNNESPVFDALFTLIQQSEVRD